jgi:hypothetical protein
MRDALGYWEVRRIPYNLALAAVAVFWVVRTWPHFVPAFEWASIPPLLILAALANVLYCSAYLVEALAREALVAATWHRWRWAVWLAGTLLALLLEYYWIGDEIYPAVPFVG